MRKQSVGWSGAAMLALAGLTACSSTGTPPNAPGQFIGGRSGDLRVLVNDQCDQAHPFASTEKGVGAFVSGLGVNADMLATIGGIAYQSFAAFVKAAGEPNITRSVASNGGAFYSGARREGAVAISPAMRCIYVVRNAFGMEAAPFASDAPVDLQSSWRKLGLTRTPDFFAVFHVETAAEAGRSHPGEGSAPVSAAMADTGEIAGAAIVRGKTPGDISAAGNRPEAPAGAGTSQSHPELLGEAPFFRVVPDRIYIRQFQNSQTVSDSRDLAIVFNYGLASSQATIQTSGANAGVMGLDGEFAVGGVRFPGARKGDYRRDSLVALQTGWMGMPPLKPYDQQATVDLSVYVVEFAPGNQMLEDIGTYLAGAAAGSAPPKGGLK